MKIYKKIIYTLLVFISLLGCQRDIYKFSNQFSIPQISQEPPVIEFIVDMNIRDNILDNKNLKKVADYTKIPFKNIPLIEFNSRLKIAPTTRVMCLTETSGLNNRAIDSLLAFVAKGGTLFITKKNL